MRKNTVLSKTIIWGAVTAALYWALFQYAGEFLHLAHATLDTCALQNSSQTLYINGATPELCSAKRGQFIEGQWWYVLAPIAMAFALSLTHGNFTSLFWDVIGLKAKANKGRL